MKRTYSIKHLTKHKVTAHQALDGLPTYTGVIIETTKKWVFSKPMVVEKEIFKITGQGWRFRDTGAVVPDECYDLLLAKLAYKEFV